MTSKLKEKAKTVGVRLFRDERQILQAIAKEDRISQSRAIGNLLRGFWKRKRVGK